MDRPKRLAEFKIQTVCLVILTAFAVGMGLYLLRPILVPFTLAVFLGFILSPLLDLQVRTLRIPRYLALFITLLLGFAVLSTLTGIAVSSVTKLANSSDLYEARVEELVVDAAAWAGLDNIQPEGGEPFDPKSIIPENFLNQLLGRGASTLTTIASQSVLVLLFVLFLLLGRATPTKPLHGTGLEIERSVKRYIITKVIVSSITGTLTYIVLNFLGVPNAIAFGAFAFLLNFIPSIGSIIATLLPLPVLLLQEDMSTANIVLALLIPGMIQFSLGSIIEPKLLGDSLDLHPVVILLALIFWGMIWGPIGMLLAAPLTAIAKIVLSKIEVTAAFADLLGGRLDSFYEQTLDAKT